MKFKYLDKVRVANPVTDNDYFFEGAVGIVIGFKENQREYDDNFPIWRSFMGPKVLWEGVKYEVKFSDDVVSTFKETVLNLKPLALKKSLMP